MNAGFASDGVKPVSYTHLYTYSGNFKSKSDMEEVEVSSKDEWQTCEIVTPAEEA